MFDEGSCNQWNRILRNGWHNKPPAGICCQIRVEANLRLQQRYTTEKSTDEKITFAGIVISQAERIVTKEGKIIPLTVKEFELLMTLMEHKNQVMTREQLLDSIWGYDFYGGTRTVDVHVAQLRQKLDLYEQLETVYKVGYKLKDINKI